MTISNFFPLLNFLKVAKLQHVLLTWDETFCTHSAIRWYDVTVPHYLTRNIITAYYHIFDLTFKVTWRKYFGVIEGARNYANARQSAFHWFKVVAVSCSCVQFSHQSKQARSYIWLENASCDEIYRLCQPTTVTTKWAY